MKVFHDYARAGFDRRYQHRDLVPDADRTGDRNSALVAPFPGWMGVAAVAGE